MREPQAALSVALRRYVEKGSRTVPPFIATDDAIAAIVSEQERAVFVGAKAPAVTTTPAQRKSSEQALRACKFRMKLGGDADSDGYAVRLS